LTVIDLDLPETNSLLDVMVLATKVTGWLEPELVVAHEEFGALPAAQVYDLPSLFVTDWFVGGDRLIMGALRYAREIVFADWEGRFEEPPQAEGKVRYVGPILREFEYSTADRARARRELGLAEDGTVIAVLPGGYATEERAPIADLVVAAFDRLKGKGKRIVWVAGDDAAELGERYKERDDILVLGREWQIDRVMAASDAAITKANRKTVVELESLGVRQVALSPGVNPIDDQRAMATDGATFRRIEDGTPEQLEADLAEAIRLGPIAREKVEGPRSARVAAERIAAALDGTSVVD
jgi:UDP-N-acetylglucosamine:LPS N-acetylglucosamine transferase